MYTTLKRALFMLSAGCLGCFLAVCSSVETTQQCTGSDCVTPTCSDGVKNGGETGKDCGGSCTQRCGTAEGCSSDGDCQAGLVCAASMCAPPSCTDQVKNGDEGDKDCGGSCPTLCANDATCNSASDCSSQSCASGRCAAPSCTDQIKNGTEGDVDCGGSCTACAVGRTCATDSDCAPWLCPSAADIPEGQSPRCGLGSGKDQALSVPTGVTQSINTAASPATGTSGAATLTVTSVVPFAAGQPIFIHQTQGQGAGANEFNQVVSISGTTLTLKQPLANSYVTGSQAVVVPQYTDVTVAAGGTLTAPAWDGRTGGILVFQATGNVSVNGTVSMLGRGFRGAGQANVCFPSSPACNVNHGRTGESEAGAAAFSVLSGAIPQNNGGGGAGGSRGQDCAAGGGGSHGTAGTAGADGTLGICLVVGGQHKGGIPGTMLGTPDLTPSIFLGPAGGEGGPDEDGAFPGFGGAGGGMIVFFAKSLSVDAATGLIDVGGATGGNGSNTGPCGGAGGGMGNGGGGAAGAIRVHTSGAASLGTSRVSATGGAGGAAGSCGAGYPGGRGGNGRIHIRADGTVTGTTNPAAYQQ